MNVRQCNNLGDVLQGLRFLREHGLSVDVKTRQQIAALLGFKWSEESIARFQDQKVETTPQRLKDSGEAKEAPALQSRDNDAWVEHHRAEKAQLPDWYASTSPLPPTQAASSIPEPPHIPLLNPACIRAILIAAIAQEVNDGALDFELLSEWVACKRIVHHWPRLPRRRLDQGLQVLVDVRESMRPFARDQQLILKEINGLLPSNLFEVIQYPGCPQPPDSAIEFDEKIQPYQAPCSGALVLLLSDLGLGPHSPGTINSGPKDWIQFAQFLQRSGCSVAAYIPFSLRRLTAEMRRSIAIFPWRPETTSSQIINLRHKQRLRRRGLH